jgi:hypothetical protein
VQYLLGVDGISMPFILLNSFITVLVVLAGWEVIEEKQAQYMGAFLIMSGLMNGIFSALDGVLFYVFFEAIADSDVHHHRHLGRTEPRLRGNQVLPLHAARLAADAGGPDLAVPRERRQLQHPRLAPDAIGMAPQILIFIAFLVVLRGQGADVAGAYLVAGCPRRGAHRRFGGAGGDRAEARRLRFRAVLAADRARCRITWRPS